MCILFLFQYHMLLDIGSPSNNLTIAAPRTLVIRGPFQPCNGPSAQEQAGVSRKRESFKEKNNSLAVPKSWSDDTGLNSITPTSGIDLLIRQALARSTTPSYYDEHGNPVMPPASPLRRSMQPLENIADRMRQKRKSWYDGQIDDDEGNDNDVGGGKGEGKVAAVPTTRLLDLPTELQILVISHLALSDLERLRRTCQYYRFLLSPEYIRTLFGGRRRLAWHLTGHCHECLEEPGREKLILKQLPIPRDNNGIGNNNNLQHVHAASHAGPRRQNIQRPIYLPGSKCFNCSVRDGDLRVGTYFNLADGENKPTWPCRWCGWPVTDGGSWVHEQFHIPCYARYRRVLFVFMYLGIAQMLLGVVAATLNLVYLRHEAFVLAPTVVSSSSPLFLLASTFEYSWSCFSHNFGIKRRSMSF
ncbi:hypothetical protein G7054_g12393 [Neopestalotiopsis clavispora]|nr:hypothetical protein G7054_g12393 [Neopestalotiopsis clavispora]